MTQTILIIDDEEDIRDLLGDIFEDEGYDVLKAAHSEQALVMIKNHQVDLIVLDIWLDNSDMDGMQILKHLKSQEGLRNIAVLMISGHGNVEMAVNAMKIGAFDFIEKPFKIDHILLTVQRALEQKTLRMENASLKELTVAEPLKQTYKSPVMAALIKMIGDHADSDARILISGALGTGKTRLAKIIHGSSKRASHNLKFLNCDIFTSSTLESELQHNPKGSLVLENIERLTVNQQSDLLGILNKASSGCRLICTASDDIDRLVKERLFSSSLYDRIAVLRYNLPSLAERTEDIAQLVAELIEQCQKELGYAIKNDFLSPEQLKTLKWGGNIKQLKTAVEWMAFCQGASNGEAFYRLPYKEAPSLTVIDCTDKIRNNQPSYEMYSDLPLKEARDVFEYNYLSYMMDKFDGNIARMATFIEMDRTALHRKLKSMNLTVESKAKAENS